MKQKVKVVKRAKQRAEATAIARTVSPIRPSAIKSMHTAARKKALALVAADAVPQKNALGQTIPGADQARAVFLQEGRPINHKRGSYAQIAREAFLETFDRLGGVEGLVAWASAYNENLSEFYKIYARMIPKDVHITDETDIAPNYLENVKETEVDAIIKECYGRIQ
jgi:hypothetical protein